VKKHYILLAFILAFFNLQAQFKTINFGHTSATNTNEEIRILNPLGERANSSQKDFVSFDLKSLGKIGNISALNNFKVLARNNNGLPIAIEGAMPQTGERNKPLETRVFDHLGNLSSLMRVVDPKNEFKIKNTTQDAQSNSHVRMQQQWAGIPVYGAEIIVHTLNGNIDFVNGNYYEKPTNLAAIAKVSKENAAKQVTSDLGAILNFPVDKTIFKSSQEKSELVFYPTQDNTIKLAYHITTYKNLIDRWEYFVDANDGSILNKYQSICKFHNHVKNEKCESNHSLENKNTTYTYAPLLADGPASATAADLFNINRTVNTYQVGTKFYMIDASRPMFVPGSALPDDPQGSIWTIDAFNTSPETDNFKYDHVVSGNNAWSSKTAVSAHYNGGKAYEYYKTVHARNSINGKGGNIISLINIADKDGSNLGNAFWNGEAMFYGNGDATFLPLAKGLDVAGHEMTHGVVQNTANLEYQGESGALNESFADVFGSLIDRDDWLIGEDVVKPGGGFASGALRSLQDPHNGAATGDFGSGWQPRKFSERYTGTQDNGGVHLNSGIPNNAYFLFASNAAVGKDKAEKVYYKVLSDYLTKSSKFIDARIAVLRAAKELYGDAVASVAAAAWDAVEVTTATGGTGGGTGGTNYQKDETLNPGQDLIVFTSAAQKSLYLFTIDGQAIGNPLSKLNPISKPTVSDDGSLIMFVAEDKKIHYIQIDYAKGTLSENTLNTGTSLWRNVALSKDGMRISALKDAQENKMWVFDLVTGNGTSFVLKNPTFTTGVATGDVQYADAMEWDFTNEKVMYDSFNKLKSVTTGTIEYWDIGVIKTWEKGKKAFAAPDQIQKIFPSLDEGESVGNPTFSKNSPYIIAFDYLKENKVSADQYAVLGANIETGDIGLITDKAKEIAYPSFSKDDKRLMCNVKSAANVHDLNIIGLDKTKIVGDNLPKGFDTDAYWGVWFSNGARVLSGLSPEVKILDAQMSLYPNPTSSSLTVSLDIKKNDKINYEVLDVTGRQILKGVQNVNNGNNNWKIDVSSLNTGMYFIKLNSLSNEVLSSKFSKI
jgi:bacillolysin